MPETLMNAVNQLEKSNIKMNNKISSLKEINEELHVALNSNKEDTHEVISILGDMTEEISKISKQEESADKFIRFVIPTTTVPLILSLVCCTPNCSSNFTTKPILFTAADFPCMSIL